MPRVLGSVAVAAGLLMPQAVAGQWAESPLVRQGQLSVFITPFMSNYGTRYGLTADGTELIEPLGADLTDPMLGARLLPGVVGPQQRFSQLLQDSAFALNLGQSQARVFNSMIRVPVGASLGVFDWLTVGGVAPFVKRRVEFDFLLNPEGGNTGLSPGASAADVLLFLGQANAALSSVTTQVDARCLAVGEVDPSCVSGRAFINEASTFFLGLEGAYAGPLFLFGQGSAADALTARLDGIRAQMHALADSAGIDTTFVAPLPFSASPLSVEQFQSFITNGAYGIAGDPLGPSESVWELGDVEVFAAVRLLGTDRDPALGTQVIPADSTAAETSSIGYLLGVQTTYRLGTGTPARAESVLDIGSGDGLNDLEVKVFGRLDYGYRLRARLEAVYGIQFAGDVTNRVYERDLPFASFLTHMPRRVDPGDYRVLMFAPEVRLTPEVSIGARFRSYHRGLDSYESGTVSEAEETLLTVETGEDLTQWGLGVSFWPSANSQDEGAWPVALTAEYLSAASGSGGQVPTGGQLRIQMRLFFQAW